MAGFKKNQKVRARTTRGSFVEGTFVASHGTIKGDWYEIKPSDGSKNFKTRPGLVVMA